MAALGPGHRWRNHRCPGPANAPLASWNSARPRFTSSVAVSSSSKSDTSTVVVPIPQSQQEAVNDACAALTALLQPLMGAKGGGNKGFTTGGAKAATRFAVDIPIADPGAAAAIDLVKSLITGLPAGSRSQVVVVHADDAAAQLARSTGAYKSAGGGVYSLAQAAGGGVRLLGLLLLVGLQPRDGPAAAKLVAEAWSGPALVLVNAAPAEPSVLSPPPAEYSQLLDEALVAYSFLPVAVRGLLGSKEGAVLRSLKPASPGAAVVDAGFKVLQQRPDGSFVQVGQSRTRPSSSDLELIFMNASAASSPLTAAAKLLRSVVNRSGGGGGKAQPQSADKK